jgi:hypothetical protein
MATQELLRRWGHQLPGQMPQSLVDIDMECQSGAMMAHKALKPALGRAVHPCIEQLPQGRQIRHNFYVPLFDLCGEMIDGCAINWPFINEGFVG